jgi:hypothetical protein
LGGSGTAGSGGFGFGGRPRFFGGSGIAGSGGFGFGGRPRFFGAGASSAAPCAIVTSASMSSFFLGGAFACGGRLARLLLACLFLVALGLLRPSSPSSPFVLLFGLFFRSPPSSPSRPSRSSPRPSSSSPTEALELFDAALGALLAGREENDVERVFGVGFAARSWRRRAR